MSTWTVPTVISTYSGWPTYLQERSDSQAKMFDDGVTWTSLPTDTIRWNSSNSRFEKWNGSAWANLSTALTDVLKTANNLSELTATASTARTNLGLGTMAVLNSPLGTANGGTGGTTPATARTGLELLSMALQAASAVAITGGTLSGITALTMTSASTLSLTSSSTISGANLVTAAQILTLRTTSADYAITFATNSVSRFSIHAAGFVPATNNTYDIGTSALVIKDIYATRLITGLINNTADIAFQIGGTTYWVMGSSAKDFRPNGNNTQDLGGSSYYWNEGYITSLYTDSVINKSGSSAYINYGAGTGNLQLGATTAVDIYVNGALRWYFGSDGKINPFGAAPDYAISYAWSVDRDLSSGSDLPQLSNVVATVIADLVTLGIFS